MAYPVGVVTRDVSFGSAFGLEDATDLEMKVTIQASRSMVWVPTGAPAIKVGVALQSDVSGSDIYSLPVTNQEGWGDGRGNLLDVSDGKHTHSYQASIGYFRAGKQIDRNVVGPFVLPSGGGVVDIDNMLPEVPEIGPIILAPRELTYTDLPPGTIVTVYYTGLVWPPRPTNRPDLTVHWIDRHSTAPYPPAALEQDLFDQVQL